MNLELFEMTDEVVEIVRLGGPPFNLMPEVFAWSICFMEAYGGILLILGLNTRITSFFVFITMGLAIIFRKWDGTWDVIPIFLFFCLGLFYMGFGSGKFGLDYYISQRWR
ncbi:DoxX family protein [Maribacter sp. X9]|uniref:DoxX family protein n=1 Tax=Maribacter sp. X9 TaxID=3402159 RepID=UPI003AF382AE